VTLDAKTRWIGSAIGEGAGFVARGRGAREVVRDFLTRGGSFAKSPFSAVGDGPRRLADRKQATGEPEGSLRDPP